MKLLAPADLFYAVKLMVNIIILLIVFISFLIDDDDYSDDGVKVN